MRQILKGKTKPWINRVALLCGTALFMCMIIWCGSSGETPPDSVDSDQGTPIVEPSEENPGTFSQILAITDSYCSKCHKKWANSYDGIMQFVTVGNPDESKIFTLVKDDTMPKGTKTLSATEKEIIRTWIASGATQ